MDRAAWIDAFVMYMNARGSRAGPETLTKMAEAYWLSHHRSDPAKVAQWRIDEFGPLHDD